MADTVQISDKIKARRQVINDGGFYGKNNVWNSIVTIPGDPNLYRKRVETLIIRNGKEVFLKKKPDGEYRLPGGSTERDIPDITQAANECREEARMKVSNIQFTGITYRKIYSTKETNKVKSYFSLPDDYDKYLMWNGVITDVYVGTYDGMDHDKVEDVDRDKFIESGRFYTIKEFFKFASKEHREAMSWYLKFYSNKNNEDEEEVTESYISNYFGNRKLLKTFIDHKEISSSALDKLINSLDKEYDKLSMKSKSKREAKNQDKDSAIFYPVLSIDFTDGQTIILAISFYDSFSPGEALNTEEYGNLIMLFPKYFKQSLPSKYFTLLHEIGHVRLGHMDDLHMHRSKLGFGDIDNNDYRDKLLDKGKVPYIEWMADLYAILHGAKLYTILTPLPNKDSDKSYNYYITRAELAKRYSNVYNWMRKNKAFNVTNESTNDKIIDKPTECPKCHSKNIGVYLYGEPIYKCKDCGKFLGVVGLKESTTVEDIKKGLYLLEAARKRSKLPDSAFGTNDRRYPLDTKKHVYSAIRLFGHCDEPSRPLLAKRIFAAMKKYNIPMDVIGPKNSIKKYM